MFMGWKDKTKLSSEINKRAKLFTEAVCDYIVLQVRLCCFYFLKLGKKTGRERERTMGQINAEEIKEKDNKKPPTFPLSLW